MKRVDGQIAGIQRMIDDNRGKAAQVILSSHIIDTCVAKAFDNGITKDCHEKLDERFDVLGRYGKL